MAFKRVLVLIQVGVALLHRKTSTLNNKPNKLLEQRKGLLDDNTIITIDNIQKLSKVIALSSLKNFKRYAYSNSEKIESLYKQLQYDICYHKELDIYSDAYDLVQEASLFLLQFLNKKLGENI